MDKKTILRVGIIGCGRIGSLWDESTEANQAYPKTHALAYTQNKQTDLKIVCDRSIDRAREAAKCWNVPQYTNSVQDVIEQNLDLVSICTTSSERLSLVREFASKSPNTVLIIEKPLALTRSEAEAILDIIKTHKVRVGINYSRRYTPGIQDLKNNIIPQLGKLQTGSGYYGNGFTNNGSHMIDLVMFLTGESFDIKLLRKINDGRETSDPTFDFQLKYSDAVIYVHGLNHNFFTTFELDLFFENGRIRLSERCTKLETYLRSPDPIYEGFTVLTKTSEYDTDYKKSMTQLIDEAVRFCHNEIASMSSTPEQALKLLQILDIPKE